RPTSRAIMIRPLCLLLPLTLIIAGVTNAQRSPGAAQQPQSALPITGRVIADDGQPLAGASVMALPANLSASMSRTVASIFAPIVTDKDGQFELKSVAPGAYALLAYSPGYVAESGAHALKYYRPGDRATLSLVKGGVITGRVTDSRGEPVVGMRVRAVRVRDAENRPIRASEGYNTYMFNVWTALAGDWRTDDRGVYRMYGLEPGAYYVYAGGGGSGLFPPGRAYDGDAPTYYPSGTADTAVEVAVQAGQEVSGIDIRYRDYRGFAISGTVSGAVRSISRQASVTLTRTVAGAMQTTAAVTPDPDTRSFMFDAVPDGDYYLTAYAEVGNEEGAISPPRRVTVRGADVTGVGLTLAPLGSIAGTVVVEATPAEIHKAGCKAKRALLLEEIVLHARANRRERAEPLSPLAFFGTVTPDRKGGFQIKYLEPALHRLDVGLPGDEWYVRAITAPAAATADKTTDLARSGILIKSGQHVTGITVAISEGAAGLRGKIVTAEAGKALPARMRVHLVPAEPEAAEDVLRYYETVAGNDGAFALANLAPGRYRLVARPVADDESLEDNPPPLTWDAGGRTGLRFEAEALNIALELKPCQRVTDYALRYSPPVPATKPPAKRTGT
ncbi:MAG TPA: carboxypeptidase-like regulatory domain-containing protein, partial [Blastocatellia bacterium]|nr:carboxypeptidase-like regulatory domain-containing protein [Blastocatellia bacterium]